MNIFVKASTNREIFTMFKPKEGEVHYERMKEEDIKNGGKV